MSPSAKRYAGPQPRCPASLDDEPPALSDEQLQVPTSELYSAALEAAWAELALPATAAATKSQQQQRPEPERVDALEPRPDDPARPRPTHHGPYALQRAALDWTYHVVPSRARQALQDEIVTLILDQRLRDCGEAGDDEPCRVSDVREGFSEMEQHGTIRTIPDEAMGRKGHPAERGRPLALFTAGGMGAGKGHTLREMLKSRQIRLPANTVWIDPDALSRLLPERPQYVHADPATASALLHPEASLLQEICAAVARDQRRSLVVDGSLTDCAWFEGFMRLYREAGYDCEILFVSAPEEVMLRRAEKRAKTTGRVTNPEAIKRSRIKSPECVTALSKPGLVRRVRLIDNSSESGQLSPDSPASELGARGPTVLYDSARDPLWPGNSPTSYHPAAHGTDGGCHCGPAGAARARTEPSTDGRGDDEGGWVDARGFVEGRLVQGEDGRVRRRTGGDEGGGKL
ncbi:hypothetical protein JCM3770_006996 [Rhodotorula araucariae]